MYELSQDQYFELEKLALGAFAPLDGFMSSSDLNACARTGRLSSGAPFPIPIVLDVPESACKDFKTGNPVDLSLDGKPVGKIYPSDIYRPQLGEIVPRVFGTSDSGHPGIRHFQSLNPWFVSGRVELTQRATLPGRELEHTPEETRNSFAKQGWKTVTGFQTRNAPHRAHEHLQKIALEVTDGLFIQPLIGKKKSGDFTPEAVMKSYQALIQHYFRPHSVILSSISTVMRYAGPKEAAFHAILRRNYGCTHFIVGRDHAGVGTFYGKYEAHAYVDTFRDLGIEILKFHGPFYCTKCDEITTEKSCPHFTSNPESVVDVSGTKMRAMIESKETIDPKLMRPEVIQALRTIQKVFI